MKVLEYLSKAAPTLGEETEAVTQKEVDAAIRSVPMHHASAGGIPQLTPGPPRQMLGETLRHVKSLPRDRVQRADAFEALAGQIETQSGGAWNAARGKGTDGADIFLGRQGEGLVVGSDGRLYRGVVGRGIEITPDGLRPNYSTLIALD
jgi:hypothetical protein